MVAGSYTIEIESPVEAKRLWNSTKDLHNFMPKHAPAVISSITILEGDGGVGTIRQVNFTEANKEYRCVKEKVDLIDEENMVYEFSHVEGGVIGIKVAYTKFKIKITPKEGGGSISTTTCSYDTLPGVPYDEAKVEEVKAGSIALFRMLEEPLLANPTLYC